MQFLVCVLVFVATLPLRLQGHLATIGVPEGDGGLGLCSSSSLAFMAVAVAAARVPGVVVAVSMAAMTGRAFSSLVTLGPSASAVSRMPLVIALTNPLG